MPTMNSPILRLDTGAWTYIATFLSYEDVRRLILTCNRGILYRVAATTTKLIIDPKSMAQRIAVDLDCILATSTYTPSLQSIIFNQEERSHFMMKPLVPLRLPPKLTELHASLSNSAELLLLDNDLSKLAPGLLSLTVTSTPHMRHNFELPPKLQHFHFTGKLLDVDISKLPRSLTSLAMSMHTMPQVNHNEWPPGLTSLIMSPVENPLVIEYLPRTLTDLCTSDRTMHFTTSFKASSSLDSASDFVAFPWRRFFPHLTSLSHPYVSSSVMTFIGSIVSPTAFDDSVTTNFLSSGFWHSKLLDASPPSEYPPFKVIEFTSPARDLVEVARTFAPFLRQVTSFGVPGLVPLAAYHFLPSATKFESSDELVISSASEAMPQHLTSAHFSTVDSRAFSQLPLLTCLVVDEISDPENEDCIRWPPGLTEFTSFCTLSRIALELLPTSLTICDIAISTDTDWNVIATRLVNLRTLDITLDSDAWSRSTPLAPIASTHLTDLTLYYKELALTDTSVPFADEFFGNPSLLPSSLTELFVCTSSDHIPLTVIPKLPRQLLRLWMSSHIVWNNPIFKTDPAVASMTPSEPLATLPPRLERLYFGNYIGDTSNLASASSLTSLPHTLTDFTQRSLFAAASDERVLNEIIDNLPPRLTSLRYDSYTVSDAYMAKRHPDFFRGVLE